MSSGEQSGIAAFTGDPDEMERRIQQWAHGFEAKAERYQAAQARTEALRLSASSPDGGVEVTVRADGTVTDLRFTEKVRTLPLAELSARILATMRSAQSGIAARVGEVMTEELGDEDQQTRAVTLTNLRTRFPEKPQPPQEQVSERWDFSDDETTAAPEPPARPAPPPAARPRRRRAQPDESDDDFINWRD